jgi:dynein heavy chain
MDVLTAHLYSNICRSLFARHKLLFSFLLTTDILKQTKDGGTGGGNGGGNGGHGDTTEAAAGTTTNSTTIDPRHLRFFLVGNTSLDLKEPNPTTDAWLTDGMWGELLALSDLKGFTSLAKDVVRRFFLILIDFCRCWTDFSK